MPVCPHTLVAVVFCLVVRRILVVSKEITLTRMKWLYMPLNRSCQPCNAQVAIDEKEEE